MNFNTLKLNFISFLSLKQEDFDVENASSDLNIFSFSNEFKEFLQEEYGSDASIFSMNITNLQNAEIQNGKIIIPDNSDSFSKTEENDYAGVFADSINDFMSNSEFINLFDTDGDADLSDEEINKMISIVGELDKDKDNISYSDFEILSKMIEEGNTDKIKEALLSKEKINAPEEQIQSEQAATASSGGSSSVSGASSSSGELSSKSLSNDLNEINKKITETNNEIIEQNNLKAEIKADDVEYNNMITDLNTVTSDISTSASKISKFEGELHTIQYDLQAAQSEYDNLSEPVIFDDDESGYKAEYEKRKAELESTIQTLKQREQAKQQELDSEQSKLETLNTQQSDLEQKIALYEQEHPDNEITKINQEIQSLNTELSQLQRQKQEKEEELKEQRETEKSDAQVYGKAQAYRQSELVKFMMDYATDPAIKEKYDKWYQEEFKGAYCAVFTSNVVELLYAKAADKLGLSESDLKSIMSGSGDKNNSTQGVTGTQFAMSSDAWGVKIQAALDAANINVQATVDLTNMSEAERKNAVREGKIYPGMVFTYKREDGSYHTGFIESINKDLSWNTIEGNTTITTSNGSKQSHTVGSHTNDATNADLSAVADPTTKVLYWLSQLNYSKSQIENLMYA